jgi:hypothetical protein
MVDFRKLDLDDREFEDNAYDTPRTMNKGKGFQMDSCYQDSTIYTERQKDFVKISASKFLFKDDEMMENDENLQNMHEM